MLLDISLFLPSSNWCRYHCSGGEWDTPNQKAFTHWSHQSNVCKENPYQDYTDSLTRFLWKEIYYSRCAQKWEFAVIEGSRIFFRDWKTRIVLILYKNQTPKSTWGKPKKFHPSDSTTYWSSHLLCIKRFTECYMFHSTMGPISETRNL